MRIPRLTATALAVCVLTASPLLAQSPDPVQRFLDSKALQGVYNGVLIDYLLEEGQVKLSDAQRKQALDQLVAALKEKTHVTQGEQLTTAMGNLVGVLMGVAGGDIAGEAGVDVQMSYGGEWAGWVDAAEKLLDAGYSDDAIAFFQWGMVNIPYTSLRGRCVRGLAAAKPDQAYGILMDALKKPDPQLQNEALRMLGHLAASDGLPQEQKDAVIETLVDYSKGMMHSTNYRAAIYGLDVANDPRAVPALSRFRKGLTVDKMDQRAALRSLLLTYKDVSVVEDLTKKLKTGITSTSTPDDRFYAGVLLMEGGRAEGFEWARGELTPKKKGFFSSKKDDVDLRPDLVTALVRVGGEPSAQVLNETIGNYKDDEWLKTWMAIGLLELGDPSGMALAKAALGNADWEFTAIRVATALAKHQDYSGIPVLKALSQRTTPTSKSAQVLDLLSGKDTEAEADRLRNLHRQVATALGEIDQPDCVPILVTLLANSDLWVRSSAAYALADMKNPAALAGSAAALKTDFGVFNGMSRNPGLWAYVLREALRQFPNEAAAKDVLGVAANSSDPSVKFMALIARASTH